MSGFFYGFILINVMYGMVMNWIVLDVFFFFFFCYNMSIIVVID